MTFGQESHNRWFTDCYLRLQWYLFPGLFCYEENDGNSFLLAANSDIATQDTLEMSAVPLDRVIKILSSVKAQHLLTVIDACRNNPETGSSSENNALTDDFSTSLKIRCMAATSNVFSQVGATPAIIAGTDNWVIEPFVGQKPEFSTKVYETDSRVSVTPSLGPH